MPAQIRLVETTGLAPAQPRCERSSPLWNMRPRKVVETGGNRTRDLVNASHPLCWLSYGPVKMDDGSGIAPLVTLGCGQPDSLASSPSLKLVEPAGCAPAPCGLKVRCATVDTTAPWCARGELHPDLGLGKAACCCCTTRAKIGRPDGICTRIPRRERPESWTLRRQGGKGSAAGIAV